MDLGELDLALAAFDRALELQPNLTQAASARLYALNYHPRYSPEQIYREYRRWAASTPIRSPMRPSLRKK
jgi:hypothetical protein